MTTKWLSMGAGRPRHNNYYKMTGHFLVKNLISYKMSFFKAPNPTHFIREIQRGIDSAWFCSKPFVVEGPFQASNVKPRERKRIQAMSHANTSVINLPEAPCLLATRFAELVATCVFQFFGDCGMFMYVLYNHYSKKSLFGAWLDGRDLGLLQKRKEKSLLTHICPTILTTALMVLSWVPRPLSLVQRQLSLVSQ